MTKYIVKVLVKVSDRLVLNDGHFLSDQILQLFAYFSKEDKEITIENDAFFQLISLFNLVFRYCKSICNTEKKTYV